VHGHFNTGSVWREIPDLLVRDPYSLFTSKSIPTTKSEPKKISKKREYGL